MKQSTSILRGLNNIRASYILESELPEAAPVLSGVGKEKSTRRRVTSSGWFAAAVSAVVALGVLTAIVLAGQQGPGTIPGTQPDSNADTPTEPVTEAITEAETDIPYTEGLEFAPVEGEEGYCSVVGIGTATGKVLRIPEVSPDGLTVKYIGSKAFMGNTRITEVILPDTVVSIQSYAFEECSNLKKVTLGSQFAELMPRAFYNCVKLNDINLTHDHAVWTFAMARTLWAENQTDEFMIYGGHLIGYLGNATDVVIPDGVVYVDGGSFNGNKRITSVVIPEGCEAILGAAFANCPSLVSVTLPSSLTHIDSGAFGWCTSLESIDAPGVTTVAYRAFTGCTSLTSVLMPSVQYIYGEAFADCTSLSSVTLSDDLLYYAEGAFQNTPMTEVTVPSTIIRMDANIFADCKELARAEVYSPMVGDGCFSGCTSLQEIILHEGVQQLGTDLFKDCTALERIVIPATVTEIGAISAIPSENLLIEYAGTAEDWANIQMDKQTAALLLPYVQFAVSE